MIEMNRIEVSYAWREDQCELKHACTAADLILKLTLVLYIVFLLQTYFLFITVFQLFDYDVCICSTLIKEHSQNWVRHTDTHTHTHTRYLW